MILKQCYIENFGKIHQVTLDFSEGINYIVEQNGWGKTTFSVFIRAMFYGMENKRGKQLVDRDKYRPWQGGSYGGYLVFQIKGTEYKLERFFGEKEKEDSFKLYYTQSGMISYDYSEKIGEEIFALDREGYSRSTYIPQNAIAISSTDSLKSKLTNVVENENDLMDFEQAMKILDQTYKEYVQRGGKGKTNQIPMEIAQLEMEQKQCKIALKESVQLASEIDEIKEAIAKYEQIQKNNLQKGKLVGDQKVKVLLLEKHQEYENFLSQLLNKKQEMEQVTFSAEVPDWDLIQECQQLSDQWIGQKARMDKLALTEEEKTGFELWKRRMEMGEEVHETSAISWLGSIFGILVGVVGILLCFMTVVGGLLLAAAGGILSLFSIGGRIKKRKSVKSLSQKENEEIHQYFTRKLEAYKEEEKRVNGMGKYLRELMSSYFEPDSMEFPEMVRRLRDQYVIYEELLESIKGARTALHQFEEKYNVSALKTAEGNLVEWDEVEKIQEKTELEIRIRRQQVADKEQEMLQLRRKADCLGDLADEKERLEEELKRAKEQERLIDLTRLYLKEAKEKFETKHMKGMQARFKHYYSILADWNPEQIHLDVGLNVELSEYGQQRELPHFSTGYQDLVGVAIRFALVDELFQEEKPVLILDDPFVNLDSEKFEQVRKLLYHMEKQYQIIYFVCHESRV